MGIVKSDHGLLAFPPTRAWAGVEVDPERRRYCYLFPDLANRPGAGLFPGTCASETLALLQEFVGNYYPPQGVPPQIKMDLPAAYTYFGQFMNHDISAPVGGREVDLGGLAPAGVIGSDMLPDLAATGRAASIAPILDHLVNEHAYPLSLTSLYAYGPGSRDPEVNALYQPCGMRFRLGATGTLSPLMMGQTTAVAYHKIDRRTGAHDLPRSAGVALIADLRNDPAGWAQAGSVTAALFLQKFAPETGAWAHMDIFAWNSRARPGHPEGGEAQAMRACYEMLRRRYPKA